jgi:D-inositol-3-phosphate glycosyltransferase
MSLDGAPRLEPLRLAMLSIHTSPIAPPGGDKTGGMNVYVLEISREMHRRAIEVDIYTRVSEPEELGQVIELAPGLRVIYLPAGEPAAIAPDALFLHLNEFRDAVLQFAKTNDLRYDAIYSHYWLSGWVAIQLRRAWKIPVAQMFHTLGKMKSRIAERPSPADDARIRGEEEIMKYADRIIAATPAERAQLLLLYRADRRKIDIVPPGVDLKIFNTKIPAPQARQYVGWPEDQKHLLFVGRIEPLKGVEFILEAIATLRETQEMDNLHLTVIGGDIDSPNEELRRLMTLRDILFLNESVHFTGAVVREALPNYYRAAEALVMPSDYESFGLVALEAMACGTPVIASEVGGLAFLIEKGTTGYLVEPRNPNSLAGRILELEQDPNTRQRIGDAAASAAQNYSWSRIVDQLLGVFTMLGTRPKKL